jgi:hypothetical protein
VPHLAEKRPNLKLKHGALHWQPPAERMNWPDARHACFLTRLAAPSVQYSFRNQLVFSVEDQPLL